MIKKPKLSILFDANPTLSARKTGIGFFTKGLLDEISNSKDVNIEPFFFDFLLKNKYERNFGMPATAIWHIPGRVLNYLERQFNISTPIELLLPKKRNGWVLFTNYSIFPSISKKNIAVYIHDLSFLDLPETLDFKNLKFLSKAVPKSVNNASIIFCISEFTKNRLLHYFPHIDESSVVVTPIPVLSKKHVPIKPTSPIGIKYDNFILAVSTIEPRKNYKRLIEAYCMLDSSTKKTHPLVIVGSEGWNSKDVINLLNQKITDGENILWTEYCSEDDKAWLYSNARLFIFPTLYEGFGMPLIEALDYGLPSVVSDIEPLREIGGNQVIYFNQKSVNSIKIAIEKGLTFRPDNAALHKIVSRYTWKKTVQAIVRAMVKYDSINKV